MPPAAALRPEPFPDPPCTPERSHALLYCGSFGRPQSLIQLRAKRSDRDNPTLATQVQRSGATPEPELPFIADLDIRNGIQDRIQAAWIDFVAREWMGATIIAGNALEALLLWALKQLDVDRADEITRQQRDEALDKQNLGDLIRKANNAALISEDASAQACIAKDARNLLHPGRVARCGEVCSKATALAALAAIYRIIEDLKSNLK